MAELADSGSPKSSSHDPAKTVNPRSQTPPPPQPATTTTSTDPALPAVSLTDGGLSRRPRDSRIIHMLLANMGVTAYQERVPMQLMDFAYRHTSSILQDALHFTSDAYNTSGTVTSKPNIEAVSLSSVRLAVSSRTHYQFNPGLPKEQLQELAAERNKVALPPIAPDWTLRLPSERYTFTGAGFGLKDAWDSEGEEVAADENEPNDQMMMEKEDDEEDEKMEDFFGDGIGAGDEDQDMENS
ncbi:Transcription initiation factor TFIID subunit 9 [Thelotrema lepadinum]|nr:Transcription initiation factor TFIID subunit 9 [Thelotrema lepadinum]